MAEDSRLAVWLWRDRHRIAGSLLAMHAISAEDAVAYVPQSDGEKSEFARMRGAGIVREAIKGSYWLDRAAFEAETEARRRRAIVPVVLAVLAIVAVLMLFYRG